MELSEYDYSKHCPDRHPIDHCRLVIQVVHPPLIHVSWAHRWYLCLMRLPYGFLFISKFHIDVMLFFPFIFLLLARFQSLSFSWAHISFIIASTNYILVGLPVASLKVKVSFTPSMFKARGLVNLGILSGDRGRTDKNPKFKKKCRNYFWNHLM